MAEAPDKPKVCVTGASGFLGSHVVRALLERGYPVRGTVRDPDDPKRTAHLRALAEANPGTLELVRADLLEPAGFGAALDGCEWLAHTASPARLGADDPQRKIVDPAVQGTRNVLSAALEAGVDRVVVTSSIAAVMDDTRPPDHVFTEADWNESATLESSPYPLSKTLAEKEAWRLHAGADETTRFRLVTINPTVVWGSVLAPAHVRTSPAFVEAMLTGKMPVLLDLHFNIVDAVDVAAAHVAALEKEDVSGRYILNSAPASLPEVAGMLREAFPDRKIPRLRLPGPTAYMAALFDKRLSVPYLRRNLGWRARIDASRARSELGIAFRPVHASLMDTARSMIDLGLV